MNEHRMKTFFPELFPTPPFCFPASKLRMKTHVIFQTDLLFASQAMCRTLCLVKLGTTTIQLHDTHHMV